MKTIEVSLVEKVRIEVAAALEKIAADNGLLVKSKGARYSDSTIKFSPEFYLAEAASAAYSHTGFAIGDAITCSGENFVVHGFKKTGTLLIKRISDGKMFSCKPAAAKKI